MGGNWQQRLWQGRGIWITAPSITILVLILRFSSLISFDALPNFLQSWEWAVFDEFMRLRPAEPRDPRIAIVGIDESDYRRLRKEINQVIIPDLYYARLLEKLNAMQPRAIGLDIYRDAPVEPGHDQLKQIFETNNNIIGIQGVAGDLDSETIDPPPALKAKGQVGANDLVRDSDEIIRRGFISIDSPHTGETIQSLGFYLAFLYLQGEGIGYENLGNREFKLGEATFAPFHVNDGAYVGADAGGYQILINYRGSTKHFETVSLFDVLEDRVPKDWAKDRIILIGAVSQSSNDLFSTPYSAFGDLSAQMPGVEIHANITSQIISAAIDNRSLFKCWPEPLECLWILFWAGVGSTLSWTLRHDDSEKYLSIHKLVYAMIAIIALFGSGYGALLAGWWIPVVPPFLAFAGSGIAITIYIARTAGNIRKTFGRYLSDEIVSTLLEKPEGLKLGGERRKITILTSDLRGFTATSERLPPEEVVKILNFYLGHMADVITKYQGTIDEFMGDGILVLFGAPIDRVDDAQRALACAVEMQLRMSAVNEQMALWQLPPLEMGIGINTGEVVVGNLGSEKRTKYGIVGNQVNLTYRIESYTTGGQIFISQATLEEAGQSIIRVDGTKEVQPKGVRKPITIYDVGGIEGKYQLFLSKEDEVFFSLKKEINLTYTILEGKHVGENVFPGAMLKLSAKGAQIVTNQGKNSLPPGLTNIKLNLINVCKTEETEDIYAKVLEYSPEQAKSSANGQNQFFIRFTSKPPDVEAYLREQYQLIQASG